MQHKAPESLKPVPPWVAQELRALDDKLTVRWNPKRDRWQIMRRREKTSPPNALTKSDIFEREWWQYVSVFFWEEPDGSFRELDMRLIHVLRKSDMHQRGIADVLREMEAEDDRVRRSKSVAIANVQTAIAEDMHSAVVGRAYSGAHASGGFTLF